MLLLQLKAFICFITVVSESLLSFIMLPEWCRTAWLRGGRSDSDVT